MHLFIVGGVGRLKLFEGALRLLRVQLLNVDRCVFAHLHLDQGILIHVEIVENQQIVPKTVAVAVVVLYLEEVVHLLSPIIIDAIDLYLLVRRMHDRVAAANYVLHVGVARGPALTLRSKGADFRLI